MTSVKIGESRDSFSDAQIQQALKLCKDTTRDHVLQMITTGIDIGLQQLEAKREDATAEELADINKGIREIQEKESQVRDRYKRNFEAWFDSGESSLVENTASGGSGNLSLVDTESLEQQIIVERMSAGAAAETQSQYAHLNRRFCLLKDMRIKPTDSAIGPTVQGKLLVDSLDAIDVPAQIRVVGLRVMELHFSEALGYLYSTLNEKLIEMGFMPEIKHHIWRTADTLRAGRGQSSAGMSESQRQVMEDRRSEANADDIGSMLKSLLGNRLGDGDQDQDETVGQSFIEESGQLLDMLDSMEDDETSDSLLERLDSKAEELSEAKPVGATREVLELVDKLGVQFQRPFLKSPESRQAAVAKRMVTPLGKLAVIDPSFLMEAEHPVREALKQLRVFADILEIRDLQVKTAFLNRFEAMTDEFEGIAAMTLEQQKEYTGYVAGAVSELKRSMQQNIGRVHQYHKELEQQANRSKSLLKLMRTQAEPLNLSAEANSYLASDGLHSLQHIAVGQDLDLPDEQLSEAIGELLNLLSGDISDAETVYKRMESLGLFESIYRLQSVLDGSINTAALQGQVESPEDQMPAQKLWFGQKIKPGAWLKLPDENSESASCCRLYRIYEEGRRCIFVDGLGLKAAELTAGEVQSRLEEGRIKLVS